MTGTSHTARTRSPLYFDAQEEISEVDGILFKGERLIITESMRKEMLQIVQESHMGMVRCKQLARDIMYWPDMNAQIEDIVSKCHICQTHHNQQPKEPMKPIKVSTAPWSVLAANLLNCNGVMYLVVIDYYSEFIEVEALKEDTKSEKVIERLTKMFAVHGIPDKLVMDNGLQFISYKFEQFGTNLHFTHVRTSPHHHKVNGMVERTNQKVRQALDRRHHPCMVKG